MQSNYLYSTKPQAAPVKKIKYREDEEEDIGRPRSSNLMHDPRVFRGSNVVNKLMSSSLNDKKMIADIRRPEKSRLPYSGVVRSSTPPPVRGRQHTDMQTEEYLETLSDRPEETEISTQTPAAMDRPSTPLFVRAKTGVDAETQIVIGDLFDFDLEVEPLLEVLVGRTIHVAMLEVMQEEELEAVHRQQEEFEAVRNIELSELQRLEAEATRRAEEKKRRVQQEQQRVEEQRQLETKVAARSFAQQYLTNLHDEVFAVLEEEGAFRDPLRTEVEEMFMPALMVGLRAQFMVYQEATHSLASLLTTAVEESVRLSEIAIAQRAEEEEEARAIEEAIQAAVLLPPVVADVPTSPADDGAAEEEEE